MKAAKAAGPNAVARDQPTAFPGMPAAAAASGAVDRVVPPVGIADALCELAGT